MKREIELLAPGGDIDSIKAAIVAGADAVYCGLNKFNARNRATNISFAELRGVIHMAHRNNCKVFLTLNILILGSEFPYLLSILNKLINTKIDGVIVQDLGLLYLLSKYFKGLKIHASTQLNTHNEGQVAFLRKLSATRVTLSRELNIHEIKAATLAGQKNNIATEIFVHGSYCISFSGICYMSSVQSGNSGNRGRCGQPCRDQYCTTPEGKNFPLNLKDNSAYFDLKEISEAGVSALKIEGRIKKLDYVYTVVNCWKKQIRSFYDQNKLNTDNSDLYKVFNRDFSNAYLKGDITKDMFIDNPRDNSIKRLAEIHTNSTTGKLEQDEIKLYEEKEKITTTVKHQIEQLSIAQSPLKISISGKIGRPLNVSVQAPGISFSVLSARNLTQGNNKNIDRCLNPKTFLKKFSAINNTGYTISHLGFENLPDNLFIAFSELTAIKNKILSTLNGSREILNPIEVPFLQKQPPLKNKPTLAVLLSSPKDLTVCEKTTADFFFQLPNGFKNEYSGLIDLFETNNKLIPWFPSVLIGEHFSAAVEFLQQVQPKRIVTNNTGIAYEADNKGIPWVAGPYLNVVNSFSLLCLKDNFNCDGAFISNEISKQQIKSIIPPENFKLYYRIYHPVLLLTSRQCLLHPVIGCEKNSITAECIQSCHKSSPIKNLQKISLYIEKSKGNYHSIYYNHNLLNTNVVRDFPNLFSSFCIDLRDIRTETKCALDKSGIIKLFENLLNGIPGSQKRLKQMIHPSTNAQYKKGI